MWRTSTQLYYMSYNEVGQTNKKKNVFNYYTITWVKYSLFIHRASSQNVQIDFKKIQNDFL